MPAATPADSPGLGLAVDEGEIIDVCAAPDADGVDAGFAPVPETEADELELVTVLLLLVSKYNAKSSWWKSIVRGWPHMVSGPVTSTLASSVLFTRCSTRVVEPFENVLRHPA